MTKMMETTKTMSIIGRVNFGDQAVLFGTAKRRL